MRATACPSLGYSLAKVRLVNAMRNVDGIESVMGGPAQKNGEVDAENEIVVFGRSIYLPPSSPILSYRRNVRFVGEVQ